MPFLRYRDIVVLSCVPAGFSLPRRLPAAQGVRRCLLTVSLSAIPVLR